MEHEGMVHALEEIHRLLRPGGMLIDIHPQQEAPLLKVVRSGRLLFSEPVPGHDAEDYRRADEAVARVVRRGLFALERTAEFDFLTYAGSVSEMRKYLEESNAYEEPAKDRRRAAKEAELAARVEQVMRTGGRGAKVVHDERTRINRLRRIAIRG
jgi:SAM-dependent methyltransferase